MTPLMYRVIDRRDEQADTVTVEIEPVDGAIPSPTPGQFNMLWAFGVGEAPISLAGFEDGIMTHTVRRAGAVTKALCAAEPGEEIGVRGPFGRGWDLGRALGRDVVVVAGGIGIAPLRPVVHELIARRDEFNRAVVLVGARNPESLLYTEELIHWGSRPEIDLGVTVDIATRSWRGDVGVVTYLIDRAELDGDNTTAFLCGPEVMMRFAAQSLIENGTAASDVVVSLERNMHCAIGHCGHCQLGPDFICKDGPVTTWSAVEHLLRIRER